MFSTTSAHPGARGDNKLLAERKEKMRIDTEAKEKVRQTYLDLEYQVADGADSWERTGRARVFRAVEEPWKDEAGKLSDRI